MDIFGAPNCELSSSCAFVNNALMTASELQNYESALVRREDILYFDNDVYDNLFMEFVFTITDPLDQVVNYDLT